MIKETKAILKKPRTPLKRFRSLAGRLQHAARILPSARAFFTPINNALRGLPAFIGLGRNSPVRRALLDMACLIRDLARRPTHVSELVPQGPEYTGFCDASAFGAGGVWFGGSKPLEPLVWRVQWPTDITNEVVLLSNPTGRLTNSDLEMAGVLLQETVLEARLGHEMRSTHTAIGSDNSPAVAWTTRMATRSASPISYHLLKGFAMRQRVTRSAPPSVYHVAGIRNKLADVASRPLAGVPDHFHLLEKTPDIMCPDQFLTLFNTSYPLPQMRLWHNVQPPSVLWCNVISTLRGQLLEKRRWTIKLEKLPGPTGPAMPVNAASTRTCGTYQKHSSKHAALPLPPGFELESSGMRSRLDPKQLKKPPSHGANPRSGWV
jgi:hypothetical protein